MFVRVGKDSKITIGLGLALAALFVAGLSYLKEIEFLAKTNAMATEGLLDSFNQLASELRSDYLRESFATRLQELNPELRVPKD